MGGEGGCGSPASYMPKGLVMAFVPRGSSLLHGPSLHVEAEVKSCFGSDPVRARGGGRNCNIHFLQGWSSREATCRQFVCLASVQAVGACCSHAGESRTMMGMQDSKQNILHVLESGWNEHE